MELSLLQKAIVMSVNALAAPLLNFNANVSLPSIVNQWWCPLCSTKSEGGDLCEMCQEILIESLKDLPKDNQSLQFQESCYEYAVCNNETLVEHDAHHKPRHDAANDDSARRKMLTSLTVRDRRHKHESNAEIIFKKIVKNCRQNNKPFTDRTFPPSPPSLGDDSFPQCSQWLRISEVVSSSHGEDDRRPWMVLSSPQPSDIQQGALGNCWLVAVLALISEKPQLLKHILLTKDYNNEGVYLVRICHNGVWKTIIVDDKFPCTKHKHLVFTRAKRHQLYAPLIEKACAKLFHSYAALKSGTLQEGLQLLTGAPCDYIDTDSSTTTVDGDAIWQKLWNACEAKLLIGTSTGMHGVSSDEYARVRIHKYHGFSLLAAHVLDDNPQNRFVLVRDPHSHSEYREEAVTEMVLKKLRSINPARRSTGAFWMSWRKFLRYFSSITISTYSSELFDIREVSNFTQSSTDFVQAYFFQVPKESLITISVIHHRDDRTTRSSHTQSFVLCDLDEHKGRSVSGKSKAILASKQGGHTYWSGSLKVGNYVLVPFSSGFWNRSKANRKFTVVIHSSVQLQLAIKQRPATFLSDCLICAAEKHCKKQQSADMIVYTTQSDVALKMLIAENQSTTRYLNFDVNVQQARNFRHSRHASMPFNTHDCIPPRHRQLVFITEWIDKRGESAVLNYSYSYIHGTKPTDPMPSIDNAQHDIHSPRPI